MKDTCFTRTRLIVSELEIFGFHGWYPEERAEGNLFRIDLELEGSLERAIATDRLEDSVDYTKVVETVRDVNEQKRFRLIESFAGAIADELLHRFPMIDRLTVRVRKLDPPGLKKGIWVAFELTKERESKRN